MVHHCRTHLPALLPVLHARCIDWRSHGSVRHLTHAMSCTTDRCALHVVQSTLLKLIGGLLKARSGALQVVRGALPNAALRMACTPCACASPVLP